MTSNADTAIQVDTNGNITITIKLAIQFSVVGAPAATAFAAVTIPSVIAPSAIVEAVNNRDSDSDATPPPLAPCDDSSIVCSVILLDDSDSNASASAIVEEEKEEKVIEHPCSLNSQIHVGDDSEEEVDYVCFCNMSPPTTARLLIEIQSGLQLNHWIAIDKIAIWQRQKLDFIWLKCEGGGAPSNL